MNRAEAELGEAADIVALYRRYARWLEAMVRRQGGGDGSEDIVQETYLRLSRRAGGAKLRHPQAALMKIAQNVMRNAARRERAIKRVGPAPVVAAGESRVEADQLERVALTQAILSLPEAYRDVFVLSRFSGMNNQQIAKQCCLSVKAVEWRLAKAVALCDAYLRC